jgi:hypothetical protein
MTGSTGSSGYLKEERFPRNKSHQTPKQTTIRPKTVSSRPVGVPAKARSGLVGWLEPGSSLFKPQNNHQTPKKQHNPIRAHLRLLSAYICVNRLSRDPVSGVAKSVCHRDRRSLPNRQLRCLCRTDFGSPLLDNRIKYPIHSSISFIPLSLAATGFSAIILRSSLTRLRMTAGRPPASQVLQMRPIPLYNI